MKHVVPVLSEVVGRVFPALNACLPYYHIVMARSCVAPALEMQRSCYTRWDGCKLEDKLAELLKQLGEQQGLSLNVSGELKTPHHMHMHQQPVNCGVGAVLAQKGEGNSDHLIAWFSKKLLPREQRYSTIEKEW